MKSKFFERNIILSFSDIEQKITCALSEVSPRDLQNCILFVQRNSLMKIIFFRKKFYFSLFLDNEQKIFSFLSERKRSFQNCILRVFANFWGKLFWENLFLFLSVSYNSH